VLNNTEIGRLGEELAVKFLLKAGYVILEQNWRFKKAEIDIIAKDQETLVFIEVKSRSNISFGQPEEFVDDSKESMMMDSAQRYMEMIEYDWEIRFDIISVVFDKSLKVRKIDHFKDAFFH